MIIFMIYFLFSDYSSFYYSKHVRADASNSDVSLIHGKPFLYENLLDCKFRISPDSFFQINVKAAEILNQEVLNLAKLTDRTTLLDLGCGVGKYNGLWLIF